MLCHTGKISGIPVADGFCHGNGHLTPVVSAEGSCLGHTSCLPEGVILHGTDENDGNLGNLDRCTFRQKPQKYYDDHFNQNKQGIPTDKLQLLDAVWQSF